MKYESPLAQIVLADITQMKVDAVVNSANCSLLGGGGVDGAIHKAAGPELLAACSRIGGCDTGSVEVTPGFQLPADWIIHAVAPPAWQVFNAEAELRSLHLEAIRVADDMGLKSIAFPAIGVGIFKHPMHVVAMAATRAAGFAQEYYPEVSISFCFLDPKLLEAFWGRHQTLAELLAQNR